MQLTHRKTVTAVLVLLQIFQVAHCFIRAEEVEVLVNQGRSRQVVRQLVEKAQTPVLVL
jgi:hypothetical protein